MKLLLLVLLCGCQASSPPTVLFRGEERIEVNPRHVLGSNHAHAIDRQEREERHRALMGLRDGSRTNISIVEYQGLRSAAGQPPTPK